MILPNTPLANKKFHKIGLPPLGGQFVFSPASREVKKIAWQENVVSVP
jgi:hypothetical protein